MPLTPADLVEIQQLYAAYNHAIDTGDGDAYTACLTADAVLNTGQGETRGTDELRKFAVGVFQNGRGIRHFLGNLLVTGEGDEATGQAYLILYNTPSGAMQMMTTGRYTDQLRRVDGAWKFVNRNFVADPQAVGAG